MRYIRRHSFFLLAIALAAALNYGLNENDRAQFDWLLRPISFLLQLKDGLPYRLTPEGYLSADQSLLITPACAG
ncbi:MAG: hypothetical protein KDK34_08385, partial [Leptospiraceae bacterium]|nr:hypothetical protein [Leptospiraceae bacterium]